MRRGVSLILGALVALVLAACGAVEPPPRDSFYRLEVPPRATPLVPHPSYGEAVEVTRVDVSGVVGERSLAFVRSGGALERYSYHFWTDPPAGQVSRALVERLRASGLFPAVYTPDLRQFSPLEVRGRLVAFEQVLTSAGAVARVTLDLSLTRPGRNAEVLVVETLSAEHPARDDSVPAAVEAFGHALAAVLDQFLDQIHEASNRR